MTGIHARCLANRQTASQLLICGRSRGHRNPEHYDPDADQSWTDGDTTRDGKPRRTGYALEQQ